MREEPLSDRTTTSAASGDDASFDLTLRPRDFDEVVGQRALIDNLKVFVKAAAGRKEPLDHVLFCGPPGLGKTSLAHVIAHELGSQIHVTSGPALERKGDLAGILTNLAENDVLFIDEIHRMNPAIEENLYPAMESFTFDIVIGDGAGARALKLPLKRFTLIGATTRTGLLTGPLRDRFGIVSRLDYYPPEDLQEIVRRSALKLTVRLDDAGAREIARRARGTPRIANRLLRRVRDFAEVEGDRAVYLAERERWIRSLEVSGREEILFELEVLLCGIDRFFNLRNLFGDAQPPQERDWKEELKATRDAVHRSVQLSRKLIEQRQEQALLFRNFVEGSLGDDRKRARLGAELREQRTPEESLFLLRSGLSAHQGILDQLLRLDGAPQSLFLDVVRALQHELVVSRYFCPPAALEFRAEYDRIGSVLLLEALRLLEDEKKRRAFALALLASFRALRSLRYVPSPPVPHTRRVLVILALVRSELHALVAYLEGDLPRLSPGAGLVAAAGKAAAEKIRQVLAAIPPLLAQPLTDRAQLDLQRDKLAEATKLCVGILANALDPAMGHYALFEDDAARTDQSERLRKDLWIFREMSRYTAHALEQPAATPEAAEPLRRYATEFRDVGYQLLRHSDRELFDRFLDLLEGWSGRRGESTQIRMQRLRDDCHRFAEILERALDLVSKRSELQKIPIDEASYREALAKVQKRR